MPDRLRPLPFVLLAVALLAGSFALARRIRPPADRPYDVTFVPSAGTLRWLSLGHPTLAANLVWLKAVQYMGDPAADARGWGKLRPLVDVLTDLDPRHGYAYQTTGIMLSSAGQLADSNYILEKGTRNVPNRYILPFHRAVNAFMYAEDYAEAGRWFEVAAKTPGAPSRLRQNVLAMYVKGDTAEAAISFLGQLQAEAEDDESRRALQSQIDTAVLERDAALIEAAAAAWTAWCGVRPVVPASLVLEGLLKAVPRDPFGGVYFFDEEGRVRSTVHDRRFERPRSRAQRDRALERSGDALRPAREPSR
jgi:hypothetical protein